MIIINDFNKFSNYKLLGYGHNGKVYADRDDAIKTFNEHNYKQVWKMNQKKLKLEILKELNLQEYVKIKELYAYERLNNGVLWAYRMQRLKDNVLPDLNLHTLSIDDKNEILRKVYDILNNTHRNGIYNYDLKFENFHLSTDGKLTGLDADNLRVLNYNADETTIIMSDYIDFLVENKGINVDEDKKAYACIENYAFLRLCLEAYSDQFHKGTSLIELKTIIDNLYIDKSIKDIMYKVIDADVNIDLLELIKAISSTKPYLRKVR